MFEVQTLGENISKHRVKQGMTQQELADCLGISPQAVSKWEKGLNAPDISLLPKIAALLHISLEQLFREKISPINDLDPEQIRDVKKHRCSW